jgi:mRNA degradation ribonuclease J1/J2
MNTKDISKAKDPDVRASLAALQRAAQLARKTAIQTDTEIVIVKNGQMVRISAEELRAHAKGKL